MTSIYTTIFLLRSCVLETKLVAYSERTWALLPTCKQRQPCKSNSGFKPSGPSPTNSFGNSMLLSICLLPGAQHGWTHGRAHFKQWFLLTKPFPEEDADDADHFPAMFAAQPVTAHKEYPLSVEELSIGNTWMNPKPQANHNSFGGKRANFWENIFLDNPHL